MAAQEAAEGLSEGDVAQGVAARVDGAVDVTQPVSGGPQGVGDAHMTEGSDDSHDVIWRPGEDEGQQDSEDGLGDPPLPRHHPTPPSLLRLEAGTGREGCQGRPVEVGVGRGVVFDLVVVFVPGVAGSGPRVTLLRRQRDVCHL